jgi:hypothetical protein
MSIEKGITLLRNELKAADRKRRHYTRPALEKVLAELEAESQPELREKLAQLAHEQWSGWMKYLFEKCTHPHGLCVIPDWAEERWQRQMNTAYHDLSQEEKDSDRSEADKFLAVFDTQSKPEPGEFTKKMRMRILRDQPMVDAETASFDQLVVIATEALEHLDEACGLIDSLQEQLKEAKELCEYWRLQAKQFERAVLDLEEQLAPKDKEIERLRTDIQSIHDSTLENGNYGTAERLKQALKGGE